MTTVLRRTRERPGGSTVAVLRRTLPAGLLAAVWAAGVGLAVLAAVALLLWAADPSVGGSPLPALRLAAAAWLLAQHGSVAVPGGWLGLPPLGVTLGLALALHRSGRMLGRTVDPDTPGSLAGLLGALVVGYAALVGLVAAFAGLPTARPSLVQSVAGGAVLAALAAGTGVLREADLLGLLLARLGRWADAVTVAGLALLALLAAGALLAGLAVAAHLHRVATASSALAPGTLGTLGLLVVQLAYLPDAAVWALGYAAGPGFAVGAGTTVSPFAVHLGALPALPMLAALPGGRATTAGVLIAVPALTGAAVGWMLDRRTGGQLSRLRAAVLAAGAAGLAGLGVGLACALAAGPAGPGRLAVAGPAGWLVGPVVAGLMAVPAVAVAVLRTDGSGG